ncbi:hypothetical protein Pgin01_00628 [Porphyromonas gingivalis]|nr:hypothetical protein HMPREF1553_00110 [Porphyromonas gingivalis F0568]
MVIWEFVVNKKPNKFGISLHIFHVKYGLFFVFRQLSANKKQVYVSIL